MSEFDALMKFLLQPVY